MAFWFLNDLERLAIERKALADLQTEVEWLIGIDWSFERGLRLDATICVGSRDFAITLTYPKHFPFAPPIVKPKAAEERWSSHQYSDGTLCLELGPDTWVSDLTGADMLRSAYRLLSTERPETEEQTVTAPSRHFLTTGQKLRGVRGRFCTTHSLRSFCSELPPGAYGTLEFVLRIHRNCSSIIVTKAVVHDGQVWCDPEVPAGLNPSTLGGVFCRMPEALPPEHKLSTRTELYDMLAKCGCSPESPTGGARNDHLRFALIIDGRGAVHAYWIASGDDDRVFLESNVDFDATLSNARLSLDLQNLDKLTVGIVGVGSIGSKVAISMARHGFRSFVLVDPDVLCAENLVRHQLDWSSVGDHKADAVASAIERIMPETNIRISKLHLTGQESNAALNGILRALSECSVVIDATGDDSVFNLLSSVCGLGEVPLVWGHVFEGGFGGLVARSRPGKDPTPQKMRLLFLGYCEQNPFPQHEGSSPYSGVVDGEIIVASDADVSAIASQISSIAIDTVLDTEPSRYPHSLYLVALSRSWVFKAPFCTIPISSTEHLDVASPFDGSEEAVRDGVKFVSELLSRVQSQD